MFYLNNLSISVDNPRLINQRGLNGFISYNWRETEEWRHNPTQSYQHQTQTDSHQPRSQPATACLWGDRGTAGRCLSFSPLSSHLFHPTSPLNAELRVRKTFSLSRICLPVSLSLSCSCLTTVHWPCVCLQCIKQASANQFSSISSGLSATVFMGNIFKKKNNSDTAVTFREIWTDGCDGAGLSAKFDF